MRDGENGSTEQVEKQTVAPVEGTIILSDTTRKIVEVAKMLQALVKDKNTSRQEQYYARQAVNSLNMLIASKVTG